MVRRLVPYVYWCLIILIKKKKWINYTFSGVFETFVYDRVHRVNACVGGKERGCSAKVLTITRIDDGAKGNYHRKKNGQRVLFATNWGWTGTHCRRVKTTRYRTNFIWKRYSPHITSACTRHVKNTGTRFRPLNRRRLRWCKSV